MGEYNGHTFVLRSDTKSLRRWRGCPLSFLYAMLRVDDDTYEDKCIRRDQANFLDQHIQNIIGYAEEHNIQ